MYADNERIGPSEVPGPNLRPSDPAGDGAGRKNIRERPAIRSFLRPTFRTFAPKPKRMLHDPQIDAVVFDMGGVLLNIRLQRCIRAFRRLGLPEVARLLNPYYPADIFGRLERGKITTEEFCEHVRRTTGKEIASETIVATYMEFLGDIPRYKLRAIRALRRAGVRTFMLSNLSDMVFRHITTHEFTKEGLAIDDYFDQLFLSFRMGVLKPSPEIFRMAIREGSLDPARTLFIDDAEKNVEAARAEGFRVHLAAPHEDFTPLLRGIIARRKE